MGRIEVGDSRARYRLFCIFSNQARPAARRGGGEREKEGGGEKKVNLYLRSKRFVRAGREHGARVKGEIAAVAMALSEHHPRDRRCIS